MSFGQRKTILIYEDYGCADITILLNELKTYFEPRGYTVGLTNAVGIIRGHELNESILAFFMPGGADTPYRQKLAVQGNHLIRNYVKSGGIYYGICAGAYYACRQTIFEKNIPALKVIHQCGLNLIDGKAIGTLYKELNISPFDKNMMSSAAVEVIWNDGQKYIAHYHGGPYFKLSNKKKLIFWLTIIYLIKNRQLSVVLMEQEKLSFRAFILKIQDKHCHISSKNCLFNLRRLNMLLIN